MKTYDIWREGYYATGNYSTAAYLGNSYGLSFKDACDNFAKRNREFSRNYNAKTLTFWGCRLFPGESEARQSFG